MDSNSTLEVFSMDNAEPNWITECWLLDTELIPLPERTFGWSRTAGVHLGEIMDISSSSEPADTETDSAELPWLLLTPLLLNSI
jgi:hypothetical protein